MKHRILKSAVSLLLVAIFAFGVMPSSGLVGLAVSQATSNFYTNPMIAAGHFYTVALKSDGTVWAWGDNWNGQLGSGATLYQSTTPVQVSGLSNISVVVAGGNYTVALKSDGTVWAWGANGSGQLGNGTTSYSANPVQVRCL